MPGVISNNTTTSLWYLATPKVQWSKDLKLDGVLTIPNPSFKLEKDPQLRHKQAVFKHKVGDELPSDKGDRPEINLEAQELCPTLHSIRTVSWN